MVSTINFFCVVLISFDFNYSLSLLPQSDRNPILVTASLIRDTIKNLFRTLKFNKEKVSRLTEYTVLYKYFEALTLQDYETFNKIVKLTQVYDNDKNNSTDIFAITNDWLEDVSEIKSESRIIRDDAYIISYIESFLYNLKQLKEEYRYEDVYSNINKNVLELLKDNIKAPNSSKNESTADKSDEYDIIDENEFWEPSGRRIYQGERTKIRQFPFMATILLFNDFHCAGTIIKSDLVITASSCLQLAWNNRFYRENPAFLSVRVGSSFYNGGGEVIPVLEIYFHPEYNPKNLRNNICILRLRRKLKFRRRSRRLKKIDFDRHDSNLPLTTYGITVLGWGAKQHSSVIGNPWTNILSYAVLDVYPIRDCQDIYSREYVTMKNFCAGFISKGGGACNRDVGGPGIVDGKLMGIISFGSPVCGMPDAPTVFTKVGYYTNWIEEIMEQNVPVSKKRTTFKPVHEPNIPVTYRPPKSTTFKILPLNGETMSPIPIAQIDSQLRNIDEKVFKDFLETMFNSEEIHDFKDILIDSATTHTSDKTTDVTKEFTPVIQVTDEPHTAIFDGSPEHISSERNNVDTAFTVMDAEKIPTYNEAEVQLINDIELDNIVERDTDSPKKVNSNKSIMKDSINFYDLIDGDKKIDSKKVNEDDEGMSIPNHFKDLTRTSGNNEEVLPESVLYELLSEVIKEEVENIGNNNFWWFYLLLPLEVIFKLFLYTYVFIERLKESAQRKVYLLLE